jgi:hypothetical protein
MLFDDKYYFNRIKLIFIQIFDKDSKRIFPPLCPLF